MKKAASKTVLLLILCLVYLLSQFVNLGAANPLPPPGDLVQVYIRADGSVEGTTKIQRQGDVYTLTEDLQCFCLDVRRSNIIFDGNGHTLYAEIAFRYVTNVTLKNTLITVPKRTGITLDHCSNSTIINNLIWGCGIVGEFTGPSAAAINIASGNSNIIVGNNITGNEVGMIINFAPDTLVYNNNFVSNTFDVREWGGLGWESVSSIGIFDNGKEGNYWSKYDGIDEDGDGIGDTSFVIDSYNTDNFPLMEPVPVIPEFQSWTVLLLFFVASLVGVVAKRKVFRSA